MTELAEVRSGFTLGGDGEAAATDGDVQCEERALAADAPECDRCISPLFCRRYRDTVSDRYPSIVSDSPTFVELFCGTGGLSLGFEQAGFAPLLALDNDANAIETYRFNRPWMPAERILCADIEKYLSPAEDSASCSTLSDLIDRRPDVMMGGVPCQGFSTANRQPIENDPRNRLYRDFIAAVDELEPRFVVIENVTGIRQIAEHVVDAFDRIGYHVEFDTLNAVDFGLPQNRRRVFFIGCQRDNLLTDRAQLSQVFSLLDHIAESGERRTLGDALAGLRPLKAHPRPNATDEEEAESGYTIERNGHGPGGDYVRWINGGRELEYVFNHRARYNNDRDVEIFRRLPPGGKADHPSISDIMPYEDREDIFKDKFYKLPPDEPCKTITAHMKFDCHMYIHPTQARGLTPREAARVQGFPDGYVFRGAFTRWYEQVGNAVPPPLGRLIAGAIDEVFSLGGRASDTGVRSLMGADAGGMR